MAADGNIWNRYADWGKVASSDDSDFIKQRITGRKVGWWNNNSLPPGFDDILAELQRDLTNQRGHPGHVLDFGCGLGRNAQFLRSQFSRVVGIDLPEMVAKLRSDLAAASYDALYDDRTHVIAREEIDVIYDSVVLQHIVDADYNKSIVNDFCLMPRLRYVISLSIAGLRHDAKMVGWPQSLLLMKDLGWTEIYVTQDEATFKKPHVLRVLKHST